MRYSGIDPALLAEVRRHAEREYPLECCGLMLGPQGNSDKISRIFPCRNVQDDYHRADPSLYPRDSRTAFLMDPKQLLAVHKEIRATKEEIRVIYHSHIDTEAYFSSEDLRMAAPEGRPSYPGTAYLILSVVAGKTESERWFFWNGRQYA